MFTTLDCAYFSPDSERNGLKLTEFNLTNTQLFNLHYVK